MPRRGIHPLVRTATLVLRNGASVSVETVAPATKPVMLSVVSWKRRILAVSGSKKESDGSRFSFLDLLLSQRAPPLSSN